MKAVIDSQFNYYSLVWMFHSREINNKITNLHDKPLRRKYKDGQSSFEELLIKDKSVTIHHRNIQSLATEMYKANNDLSQKLLRSYLEKRTLNTISEDNHN